MNSSYEPFSLDPQCRQTTITHYLCLRIENYWYIHSVPISHSVCGYGIIQITATLARAHSLLPGDIIKNGFTNSTEKKTMTIDTYPDCVYFIYKMYTLFQSVRTATHNTAYRCNRRITDVAALTGCGVY